MGIVVLWSFQSALCHGNSCQCASSDLDEVAEAFFGVLLDQFEHTLVGSSVHARREVVMGTNLGHDRLAVLAFDVAEWHLCTFVLVDLDLWIIDVWYLLKRHFCC